MSIVAVQEATRSRFRVQAALASLVVLLAALTLLAGIAACPAQAHAKQLPKTADAAMAWVKGQVGRKVGTGQCVALVKAYYAAVGSSANGVFGNANQYCSNKVPAGFTRIRGAAPQKGDVLVFTGGTYGHVCIYESASVTYHQNYPAGNYKVRRLTGKNWRSAGSNYWGVIRPNFKPARKTVSIAAGCYAIQSKVGNKVIDVAGASNDNGANVRIYTPRGNTAQIFNVGWNSTLRANYIQLRSSGKFLDTKGNTNGTANVFQWQGTGAQGQNWIFENAGGGYVYIRNLWGYYLDVKDGRDVDAQNIRAWEFNGSNAQKWKFVKVSGKARMNVASGTYAIRSALGKRVVDVTGAGTKDNTNVQLYDYNRSAAQVFNVGWNSTLRANYIQMKSCGKFIGTKGNANGTGTIVLQSGNGSNGQNWFFEDAGNGYVYIRNLWGYYLCVANARDANGSDIIAWTFGADANKKWKLVKIG